MITTGAELLAAVRAGETPLKRAYEINIALPSREKVFPPDLDAAAKEAAPMETAETRSANDEVRRCEPPPTSSPRTG